MPDQKSAMLPISSSYLPIFWTAGERNCNRKLLDFVCWAGWISRVRNAGQKRPSANFLPPFLESSRWEGSPYLLAVFWFARIRYAGALRRPG